MPPGIDVEEMGDDAGGDEELALRVVIDAPGIAEAVCDDLEMILGRDGTATRRR